MELISALRLAIDDRIGASNHPDASAIVMYFAEKVAYVFTLAVRLITFS